MYSIKKKGKKEEALKKNSFTLTIFLKGDSSKKQSSMVRTRGIEPPRPCGHMNLNHARLPIPPRARHI